MNKLNKSSFKILLVFVSFICVVIFTNSRQSEKYIKGVNIEILDTYGHYFIDKHEIYTLLNENEDELILGKTIDKINLRKMEKNVQSNAFVRKVDIFYDVKGNLKVNVYQALPIARVISKNNHYFIDTEGNILPKNTSYTPRIMIVEIKNDKFWLNNVMEDEFGKQLFQFVEYVRNNEFWNAQIAHLIVDKNQEVVIIPQITKQKVIFGKLEMVEEKLENLKIFYNKILPNEGWNKYSFVNIKFKNQIICN